MTAAQNIILLREVRNPNGDLQHGRIAGRPAGRITLSTMTPRTHVNLSAGNLGATAARVHYVAFEQRMTGLKVLVIYPGILNIMAGAGGVDAHR